MTLCRIFPPLWTECADVKVEYVGVMQGRPKDGPEDKFRLAPVAPRLSELLGSDVAVVQDCIGADVASAVEGASNGSVCSSILCEPVVLVVLCSLEMVYPT